MTGSKRAAASGPTGMVVIDKEPGLTSHDVVARTRRLLGQPRAGHAGTLDPDATGVLLVGLGRFTRFLRFLTGETKVYEAEVVMGTATSTLDASGDVVGTWDMSGVNLDQVRAAAERLTGRIQQLPPMVSAVKVGGKRLYELARAGTEVERPPRPVTVHRFEVEPGSEPLVFRIRVECSAGTYVRSLALDLGTALGGGAHLRALRRTAVGSFGVSDSRRTADLTIGDVLSPAEALRDLAQVTVGSEVAHLIGHGLALDRVSLGATGDGPWALVDRRARLLAVYTATATDRMVAACVLAAAG
jgi:tRNA pseudouridine55 synthase